MSPECVAYSLDEDKWGEKSSFDSWTDKVYENAIAVRGRPGAKVVICEIEGIRVGYAVLEDPGPGVHLHYMERDPDRRAERVGDHLWESIRSLVGDRTVTAFAETTFGLRFLLRHGFVPDGRLLDDNASVNPGWSWSSDRSQSGSSMTDEEAASLFDELNRHFFGGSLPLYRTRVVKEIPGVSRSVSGRIEEQDRTIYLREDGEMRALAGALLHEMAHAAVGGEHGEPFFDELNRLGDAGAPLVGDDDVSSMKYKDFAFNEETKEELRRFIAEEAVEGKKQEGSE